MTNLGRWWRMSFYKGEVNDYWFAVVVREVRVGAWCIEQGEDIGLYEFNQFVCPSFVCAYVIIYACFYCELGVPQGVVAVEISGQNGVGVRFVSFEEGVRFACAGWVYVDEFYCHVPEFDNDGEY